MEQKSLKKNAFFSFLKSFLGVVFPIITFPYASRILGPENIGQVNFSNSIVSYFSMAAGLGTGMYAVREIAKRRDDESALSQFAKEILIINGSSTLISYLIFVCTILFVPKLFAYRPLLLICSLKILFTSIGLDWLYTAFEEFKYITIRSIFFQILSLIFLFLFVHSAEDKVFYAFFGIISSVGSNIFNFVHSRKYIHYSLKTELHPTVHLRSIFIFTGMTFVTSVYTMLDTTMLGMLSTDTQVGYYAATTKLNHMVITLLTAITSVLLPRLSIYARERDGAHFTELSQKTLNIIILLSIPMGIGLFLLARPLTLLFSGANYLPAVVAMRLITPIILVIPIASITGTQVLPAINKEKISLVSYIAGASMNIICNAILIPRYGATGAAIGTVIAESTVTGVQTFYLRKFVATKAILLNFLQAVFATSIMAIFIRFYLNLVSQNTYAQLFGGLLLGLFIYALSLRILKNKYFLETVDSLKSKLPF